MYLCIGSFLLPWLTFSAPSHLILGTTLQEVSSSGLRQFSGEHNPSPLPCFLLIVSPLNVFVTRIPPHLVGKRKRGERQGTKRNLTTSEMGRDVFWHLGWRRESLICYLTQISATDLWGRLLLAPFYWWRNWGGCEWLSNQSKVLNNTGGAGF